MNKTIKIVFLCALLMLVGHFIAYKIVHVPAQLEMVVIFAVAMAYPIIRSPIIGLYISFIVLPFIPYLRRIYYLLYARPKLDPLLVVGDIVLALMLIGLFFEFRERSGENRKVGPYMVTVILYIAVLFLRTFTFNYLPLGEALAKFKMYGPPALFFLVGVMYATRVDHLKRFWVITIVIGSIASLYGYKQLYFGYSNAEHLWFNSIHFTTMFIQGIARPFSLFQAPVAFADYMQLSLIGILVVAGWARKELLLFFIPISLVFFYSALITSVRSSWIGIILTFFLWFVLFRAKTAWGRWGTLAAIAAAYFVTELLQETIGMGIGFESFFHLVSTTAPNAEYIDLLVTDRASAIYNPLDEHSLLSRMTLWRIILVNTLEPIHGFMGRGLGAMKADSLYFTYLAEFGFPGLIFIVWLIGLFIAKGLKVANTFPDPDVAILAKGVVVLNIVFAVVSITGTHIHYFPGDMYFWFWNGVVIKLSTIGPEPQQPTSENETTVDA